MPASEKPNRAFATTSFSCSSPIAANSGVEWLEPAVGLALCATMQIEQEAASVWFGWLWVDSTATVHNSKDSASPADHRTHRRIISPALRLNYLIAYNDYLSQSNAGQVTIDTRVIRLRGSKAIIIK
jgi:hypothetical protein